MRRRQVSRTQTTSLVRRFANSGPVLPFNPASSIPGCQLWFDASDTSTVLADGSSNVSLWIDKSNTGTIATPTRGASANQITYVTVDGYRAIYINNNGSAQYNSSTYSQLTIQSNFQNTADYSIFAVVNLSNVANGPEYQTIYGNARGTSGETRTPNFGAGMTLEFNSDSTNRMINSSFIGSGRLQTALISSSSALTAYTNTSAYGSATNGFTKVSTDAGSLPSIGGPGSFNDNRFATGYFHEILIYNSVLTTIQRQKVEGYLAHKWGLTGNYNSSTPLTISGCQLWLDALDSSTITGTTSITAWRDKSGKGNNAVFTGTNPSYVAASNAVITANLNQAFSVPASTIATSTGSCSIFIVYGDQQTQGSANAALFGSPLPPQSLFQSLIRSDGFTYIYNNTNASGSINTVLNTTNPIVYNMNYTYNSTVGSLRLNGTSYASSFSNVTTPSGSLTLAGTGWGDNSNIRLYEVLTYKGTTPLTTAECQQIETYLANKWGLQSSLPANHPYKTAAPKYEEPIFLPSLIPGSRIWLDASDSTKITMSDSNVTQIVDKSSNGYVFTGSTGTYPTRTTALNGLSVISSSSGKYLQNTSFNQNFTTATFFAVLRPTQDITPNGISGGYPAFFPASGSQLGDFNFCVTYANQAQTGDPSKFFIEIDKQGTGLINGALGGASPSTYNPVNTPLNIGAVMSGSSGTNSAYLNGTSVNLTANNSGTFPLQSGRTVTVFAGFGCDYAETLIYGSVLTTIERQKIEGYLAHKWKLQSSLPANHPFKSTAPTSIPKSITIQSLSAFFNNGPTTCLTIPANSALTLGTNNHTIEFWMYQVSHGQYDVPFAYGKMSPQTATTNYYMNCGSGGFGVVVGNGAGGWAVQIAGATRSLNTWHHYAVVRNGNTFTVYDNGTSVGSVTASINIPAQGDVFRVGSDGQDGVLNGYITNFRVVNGTAVYTSNFTPPTSPLTVIPNTQILIQGLVDRSPNAFTVTNNGGVALSTTVSPFL